MSARGTHWTAEEDAVLARHWPDAASTANLLPLLPGRTRDGIRVRARKLGLERTLVARAAQAAAAAKVRNSTPPTAWTPERDAVLLAEHPTCPDPAALARRLGVSLSALRQRANVLGAARRKGAAPLDPSRLDPLVIPRCDREEARRCRAAQLAEALRDGPRSRQSLQSSRAGFFSGSAEGWTAPALAHLLAECGDWFSEDVYGVSLTAAGAAEFGVRGRVDGRDAYRRKGRAG